MPDISPVAREAHDGPRDGAPHIGGGSVQRVSRGRPWPRRGGDSALCSKDIEATI